MTALMSCVAFVVGIWIIMVILAIPGIPVLLHVVAPNWLRAVRSLPVPRDVGERSGWKNSWCRDTPGTRAVMPCMVSYSEEGVLVRDLWSQAFFWGLFCGHRTMFIPWTACSNPRQPWSHRWYASALQRRVVELDVAGQCFSIMVDPDKVEKFAPHACVSEQKEQNGQLHSLT